MNYAYTPIIWLPILTVILLITLSIYCARRRWVPGAVPLLIACLFGAAWAASIGMEYLAVDLGTKGFWIKLQGVIALPIITAITCFVLEYTWPGRWLTRRNLLLLMIVPVVFSILILTNDLHHLIWNDFIFINGFVQRTRAIANWLTITYAFIVLGAINLFVLVWLLIHSPQQRWPVTFMLVGQLLGHLVYVLASSYILPTILPIHMLAMAFEFMMYAIALFGFRIFEPVPMARQTAIEQMDAGMLVLDTHGRVVSLNKPAVRILGASASHAKGMPIRDILPAFPIDQSADSKKAEIEFSLEADQGIQFFMMEISPLNDWRGLAIGRLVMLRNITEQKLANKQILEQQQALATLQERERLARELHDNAGQLLSYVSMQAQAIRKLIQDGEIDKAETQLTRLANASQEAHTDLRESIVNLNVGSSEKWSFLSTLQHHLDNFQNTYGVVTELVIPKDLDANAFKPGASVQLMRVIQEALTNARKHGKAHHVRVIFAHRDGRILINISDDGSGFNPEIVSGDMSKHFGLEFMGERMDQIGGNMKIVSQPGAGTQVLLEAPL